MEHWNNGKVGFQRIKSIKKLIGKPILTMTQYPSTPRPILPIFQHSIIPIGAKPLDAVDRCVLLGWFNLILNQLADKRFRIQQGLSGYEKSVAVGFFAGQLEAVLKILVYFFNDIF